MSWTRFSNAKCIKQLRKQTILINEKSFRWASIFFFSSRAAAFKKALTMVLENAEGE